MWKERSFILHHDNASPHTAAPTLKKLQQWGITTLEHPPSSPDLAPCNFSLFPKLKKELRGHNFRNVASVQRETKKILCKFPQSVFEDFIFEMVSRWQKCIAVNGDYFEGDNMQIDPLFEKGQTSESSSSDEADE